MDSAEWASLCAVAQEVEFDQQWWDASKAVFQDTGVSEWQTMGFYVPMARHKF